MPSHSRAEPRGQVAANLKILLTCVMVVVALGVASRSAVASDDRPGGDDTSQTDTSQDSPGQWQARRWCHRPGEGGHGWWRRGRHASPWSWGCRPWEAVDPGNPEPADPEPSAPEPGDPGPSAPEPADPEPTDAGPTIAEPTAPEPSGPTAPEPSTPGSTEGPVMDGSCAPLPSLCGFPDRTNTGIAAGTSLRAVPGEVSQGSGWHADRDGSVTVDGDGTVLEGLAIPGPVTVKADNVTIRNVRVTNDGDSWGIGISHATGTTITQVEILPSSSRLEVGIKDVYGDSTGTRITRSEIARTATGIQTTQGLIEDNFVHDLALRDGDHVNGTTSNGGDTPLTIRHNTIFNPQSQTDAISLFQDFGTEANRTVEDNLLAGGGYSIYGGDGRKGVSSNIVFRNNRISRMFFPRGGSYGPVTGFDPDGPGNVWTGNIWDDGLHGTIGPDGGGSDDD